MEVLPYRDNSSVNPRERCRSMQASRKKPFFVLLCSLPFAHCDDILACQFSAPATVNPFALLLNLTVWYQARTGANDELS
jgi:hypothetical protein